MGVLSGKDIFSPKWITAIITDAFNRRYFVPIKHTIGDYFIATIEGDIYCFKVVPSRIAVYQHTLVRSFRMIDYNLGNFMPISGSDINELEQVLRNNNLPKMNIMMFNIFKILGKREKVKFEPHDLVQLVNAVSEHDADPEYKKQLEDIKNYLTHLDVEKIITPVRKVSEFIEGDLIEPDAGFFGSIVTQIAKVEDKHKLITNMPEKGRVAWLKILLILSMICVIIFVVWWVIDSGVLNNIFPKINFGSNFGSPTGPPPLSSVYPTPEALQAAIDRGEVNEAALTPEEKKMLEAYEPPAVTATP